MKSMSIVLLMVSTVLYGQQDTLLSGSLAHVHIQEIAISDSIIEVAPYPHFELGNQKRQQPVNVLDRQSGAYIKSYGLGSLATISLWGGNANHTQVSWEEVPISNPMLGLTDLSLVTGFQDQELEIIRGGHSATHGSGSITGNLNIRDLSTSSVLQNRGWQGSVGYAMGSFDSEVYNASVGYESARYRFHIKGFSNTADNNFGFTLGGNDVTTTNADLSSRGLQYGNVYKINARHKLTLNGWLQDTERGIPPTTTQTRSVARQHDVLNRTKLGWEALLGNVSWTSAIAYSDEQNNFEDAQILIDARNRFKRLYNSGKLLFLKNNWQAEAQYDYTFLRGESENYVDDGQSQSIAGLYGGLTYKQGRIEGSAGVRREWNSITDVPWIPTGNITLHFDKASLTLKLSREFRSPTLNEIFWQPGGNPNLLPEQGWNQELWLRTKDNKIASLTAAFFHRRIANWILWSPEDNSIIWTPKNIGLVRSYGLDLDINKSIHWGNLDATIGIGYNYNRSENRTAISLPVINIGDQLVYTPLHKLRLNTSLSWNGYSSTIDATYTDTVRGINEDLHPYTIVSFSISKQLEQGICTGNIYVEIDNLLGTDYRVIERRPMPGRYFTIGTYIDINK